MNVSIEEIRKYSVIGIRGLASDEHYEIGDTCRNSFDWDYENDISSYETENPVELDGTCAVNTQIDTCWDDDDEIIEKIENVISSFGYTGKIAIIAGNSSECGADYNEVIIEDAKVIDIL